MIFPRRREGNNKASSFPLLTVPFCCSLSRFLCKHAPGLRNWPSYLLFSFCRTQGIGAIGNRLHHGLSHLDQNQRFHNSWPALDRVLLLLPPTFLFLRNNHTVSHFDLFPTILFRGLVAPQFSFVALFSISRPLVVISFSGLVLLFFVALPAQLFWPWIKQGCTLFLPIEVLLPFWDCTSTLGYLSGRSPPPVAFPGPTPRRKTHSSQFPEAEVPKPIFFPTFPQQRSGSLQSPPGTAFPEW